MALSDLTAQQRTKLRQMLNDVAFRQQPDNPQQFVIDQLFAAIFDTAQGRIARIDLLVTTWRDIRQAERDAADTDNTARKTAIDAELSALDAILATT